MIETQRLIMRHWTLDDVPSIVSIYGDPETMKLFGRGVTFSPQELSDSLEHVMAEYAYAGLGNHAVVERGSLAVIGHCGVHRGSETDGAEADWLIARDRWGRGYATEAASAMMKGAFEAHHLPTICGVAHHENVASIAVMRKLGMSFVRRTERDGFPSVVYRVTREDFARRFATKK
ncbi:MAG TPA: GNAT family N-acetyltransferase [Candidatus Cybelea sp.]|nr:GNAT family N-acetyltransferase [Candidatus Cybelea sp.]